MDNERIDYIFEVEILMAEEDISRLEAMAIIELMYPNGEIRGER